MLEALIDFRLGCGRSVCGNIIILDLFHCASLWQTIHWSGLSICLRAVLSLQSLCLLLCLSACCLAELLWDALSCCKDLLVFSENQTKHLCSFVFGIQRNTVVLCNLETFEPVMPFSTSFDFYKCWMTVTTKDLTDNGNYFFLFCDIILKFGIQLV